MVGSFVEKCYLCRMNCAKIWLSVLAAFSIFFAQAKDDVVPTIHRDIHKQLQDIQSESQAFQALVDSVMSVDDIVDEAFELFPALDLYSSWSDAVDGPLWDSKGTIPATLDIDVSSFAAPTTGMITSPFGWRRRRMHKGVDIKVYIGDTIRAAFDGKVRVKKYERRGYGYYLVLRHNNGLETVYGHLSRQLVNQDAEVKAGQPIALGGNTGRSTGPHLHFEMRFMGIALDPSDIIDFVSFKPKTPIYAFKRSQAEWAQNNKGKRGAKYRESGSRNTQVAAAKNNTTTKTKSSANNTANQSGGSIHRVKQGDTLSAIARKYGTSVSKLCKLNGIRADKTLQLGQKIRYR